MSPYRTTLSMMLSSIDHCCTEPFAINTVMPRRRGNVGPALTWLKLAHVCMVVVGDVDTPSQFMTALDGAKNRKMLS